MHFFIGRGHLLSVFAIASPRDHGLLDIKVLQKFAAVAATFLFQSHQAKSSPQKGNSRPQCARNISLSLIAVDSNK